MAYPSVNFQLQSASIGAQPIATTSTTQLHALGTVVSGMDATYGACEFIYLKGIASTAAGDVVCYSQAAATTERAVHSGTGSSGPAAVAMSANVASQYGWYAIGGSVPVKSGTVAANAACFLTSTAGQIDDVPVAGDVIDGMQTKAADSGGYATVQLARPYVNSADTETGINTGDVTLGAVGSTPAAAGASLSSQVLTLQPASASFAGLVSTGTQTFAGAKTFSDTATFNSNVALQDNTYKASGTPNFYGHPNNDATGVGVRTGVGAATFNAAGASLHVFAKDIDSGTPVVVSSVASSGSYRASYTDTSGTPGDGTANTVTGRSAIASGASACVITNSVCKTDSTSIVQVQLETAGLNVFALAVTPGNGQFTVTTISVLGAATNATGNASFSWEVKNGA